MLSREEVVAAYRHLLGREPENDEVIDWHRGHDSPGALRREILQSEEFAALYRQFGAQGAPPLGADTLAPVQTVETEAAGPDRAAMWDRVARSWHRLGEEAPHWSVLTFEKFRPEAIADNRDAFRDSGDLDMAVIDAALARLPGADALRQGLCLEVGCGVGRVTRGLSERFAEVLAVDVSAPHLEIAEQELTAEGRGNVRFRRMARIGDYAELDAPAFFYSRIVLQHNPPPVQAAILRAVLAGMAVPGAALFQIVTHIDGYAFSTEAYLAGRYEGMEMHALPQKAMFAILRETGFEPLEIERDDTVIGDLRFRSHMVLARKSAG